MQNHKKKIFELKKIITEIKVDILDISFLKNAHHIGSIFSCIDILVVLYFDQNCLFIADCSINFN